MSTRRSPALLHQVPLTTAAARPLPFLLLLLLLLAAELLTASTALGAKRVEGVVNLNTATAQELQLLPGIGPAKVESILRYREARPFRTVDELVRIKGIGRKMLLRIRPHLTVVGPTTARPAAAGPERSVPPGGASASAGAR